MSQRCVPAPGNRVAPVLTRSVALVVVPGCVAVLAMAFAIVLGLRPWAWDVAWTAAAVAALTGMLLARARAPREDRHRWTTWAAASSCWLGGQLMWNLYGVVGFPRDPNLADVGWWGFAILVAFSVVRLRGGAQAVRRVILLEAFQVAGAAIALSVAVLWHDFAGSALPAPARLSALAYPACYLAATTLMVQSFVAGTLQGSRSRALRLVLLGMAAEAAAFVMWSEQLLDQTYVPGRTIIDPLFVAGLVLIGLGGLDAARRPAKIAEPTEAARHGILIPATLFALLMGGLLRAQIDGAPLPSRVALSTGLILCGAALIMRGAILEDRWRGLLDGERTAAAALAEREAQLAELNAQLLEDARHDPLTAARNRRALAADLEELESRAADFGEGYAVALCDLDHFKAYNDAHGHLAGDAALRTVSATLQGMLPPGDFLYRFGGEEFLVVLRGAGRAQALEVAERLRTAVARTALTGETDGPRLTLSIGVAAGAEPSDAMLERADAALYEAKSAGRDRVVAALDRDPVLVTPPRRHDATPPVPLHVRSMLAISRAAASSSDPLPVLETLAETIQAEMSFGVVAVNLLDEARELLTCVTVFGDPDARAALLGTTNAWGEWERLLESEFVRHGALWIPAGTDPWREEPLTWTKEHTAPASDAAWQPDDMLLLPLRGDRGQVFAVVSVDQPADGRRPDDRQIGLLMAVADHAGLALEQVRRGARSAATESDLSELKLAAVMLLAETLDLRDPGTASHSRSVGAFARDTARRLGLPPERVERVHAAGIVHDLGKLGVADAILFKPGPLTDREWQEMQRHPEVGARILDNAGLADIAVWVRAHHERIDGRGYPDRISGEAIPLEARVLAVADAYEAMIADRPYRRGMDPAAARAELVRCAGSQFDPEVVEAFVETLEARPDGDAMPELVAA